jgi:glycosyltransferase involved in cell wall biosynthesis
MKQKILVFIPSFRCKEQIIRVLNQFDLRAQQWVDTVMVVDNQSPDDTLRVAIELGKSLLSNCNFIAWRNEYNYGLGGSHKVAFRYAIDHGFDYLVVLHGDDQANIHDLLPQLEAGAHLNVDCLLGARFMSGSLVKGYSWFRTVGNRVFNELFSLATRKVIYDLGSGLNLYRLKAFQEFYFKTFPDDLSFNYVMILASYYRNQKVCFFPISWREEDQRSNVKLFRQGWKVLSMLVAYIFQRDKFINKDLRAIAFDKYVGRIVYRYDK